MKTLDSDSSDHEFDIKIRIQYGDGKMADKKFQCFQWKILQNQQRRILHQIWNSIWQNGRYKTYFSWFSLKKTTNSIEGRVQGISRSVITNEILQLNFNMVDDKFLFSMHFNENNCKFDTTSCTGVFSYIITSSTSTSVSKEVVAR